MPTGTVIQGLPLHPGSSTDWSNLFRSLSRELTSQSQEIVKQITLDLQLYSKCMQLRQANEIKQNLIFPLVEVHIRLEEVHWKIHQWKSTRQNTDRSRYLHI